MILAVALALLAAAPGAGAKPAGRPAPAKVVQPPPQPRLAVLLVVDQLSAENFDARLPGASAGLKRLAERGFRFRASVSASAPTVTSPGHATLATATWPQLHGIVANEWFDEAGKLTQSTEDAAFAVLGRPPLPKDGTSPHLMMASTWAEALKASDPNAKVAVVAGKDRAAILLAGPTADSVLWFDETSRSFTTSTFYARELPAPAVQMNQRLRASEAFAADAGVGLSAFDLNGQLDLAEVELAISVVRDSHLGEDDVPDFLAVSFSAFDRVLHAFGPDSPEADHAFSYVDHEVGALLTALDARVGPDRYVVAFTSDHGGAHAPAVMRARGIPSGHIDTQDLVRRVERGLDKANPLRTIRYATPGIFFRATPSTPAIVGNEKIVAVAETAPGVSAVLALPQVLDGTTNHALGDVYRRGAFAGRSPDFIIVPRPYWTYGLRDVTGHASPWAYDREVPLIFFGASVASGSGSLAQPVDVLTTLAALVDMPPPAGTMGRILSEVAWKAPAP